MLQFINRGLIGGDSELTSSGIEFAKALGDFLQFDDSGFSCSSSSAASSSSKQHQGGGGGAEDDSSSPKTPNVLGQHYDFDNFG